MPAPGSVVAFLLIVVCGAVALATLGLAAARAAGRPDDDMRAAGGHLVRHGLAVLVMGVSLSVVAEHVTTVARVACALVFGLWGLGALVAGVVLRRRPGRSEPPDEDGGDGGGGGRPEPDPPPPPWWPEFERDLAAWQAERERGPGRGPGRDRVPALH